MAENFSSFLNLSELKLLISSNNKFFYKSKEINIKKEYGQDYQLGGQDNYFINLSRGAYRRDDKLTERTWKFLFKHLIVTRQVFDKVQKDNKAGVLDVGCSKGFLRRILESNARENEKIFYVGIDLSRSKLEEAVLNETSLESGAEGDKIPSAYVWHNVAGRLPVKSGSFDFAVCFQMIKYLSRKEVLGLLAEIFRSLKPGGFFFLSTDPVYYDDKKNDSRAQEERELKKKKGYKSFWSAKILVETLSKVGFKESPICVNSLAGKVLGRNLYSIFPKEIVDGLLSVCHSTNQVERFFIFRK